MQRLEPLLIHEHPTIPEPGTMALCLLGAGLLTMTQLRHRWSNPGMK
ncbi:MAG: PEP-CTERM sorting domain-containing protein [Aeoliella sp.]